MNVKATLSIEHGVQTAKGRECFVKIIGTDDDLITLWTLLSMQLADKLGAPPMVLATMLAITTPEEIAKFTTEGASIDLSHWRDK